MTDERQAVKTLAEQLVKAMKSVSANTPSKNYINGTTPSTISASKIVGLPAAFSSIINGVEDAAASGDAVAQMTLHALNHIAAGEFETITADTANIEKIYATFGDFITLVAEDATIGDLDVETIRAGLAEVGLINIGSATISTAQIERASTGTLFVRDEVGGKVYIDDLAVSEANIVNLAAGTVLINNSNGELVELYVDATTGNVSTRAVSYDGDDVIKRVQVVDEHGDPVYDEHGNPVYDGTLHGNRIVQNSITTEQLNASEIFAAQGTIMGLIADNINATRLFANQGFIPQLETTIINSSSIGNSIDLSANSSITLLQDSINLLSSNTSRTFIQGSTPFPVHLSDTWFDPATEDHYVAAGIVIPNQQMTFGHDDAGNLHNIHTEDYEFTINSDGELMVLIEDEALEDIVVENNVDFGIKEGGYLSASGLWNKIRNAAFSNLRISVDGIISEVYDSEKGSSRIEQNADRIIAIVSGSQSVPYVKTNSIEIKEDLIEIKSSGNVDIKADNFSVSFNTEGSLPSRSRVDINNDVGIRVSDRYGGYFQANYNRIGLYDMLDTPRLYMDANGQAFFNGSLTLGGVRNTDGSLTIRNENGARILFANKDGMEIYDATGNIRQFYLDSSTGNVVFSGDLRAATGTFFGKITGNSIDDGTIGVSKFINDSGFQNATQVTTITNNTIATTNVLAQNLQVNSANINGTLSVSKIVGSIEDGDWGIDFTNGKMKIGSIAVGSVEADKITGSKSFGNNWSIDFSNGAVNVGSISADSITSGTLSVGGGAGRAGAIAIYNASGTLIGSINSNGLRLNNNSGVAQFIMDSTTGNATFAGSLSAATGTFSGNIEMNTRGIGANGDIILKKNNVIIASYGSFHAFNPQDYAQTWDRGAIYLYEAESINTTTTQESWMVELSARGLEAKDDDSEEYVTVDSTGIYCEINNDAYFEIDSVDKTLTVAKLNVSGTKKRVVSTDQYFSRSLYCYETPSPYFGDIGEGTISSDGKCYIPIDPIFAQTVTTEQYHVFLQRYGEGDCYVGEKRAGYFVVFGTPYLNFSWEVKAKQSDFDQLRLDVNEKTFALPRQTYGRYAAIHIRELYNERTQQDTKQYNQESEE